MGHGMDRGALCTVYRDTFGPGFLRLVSLADLPDDTPRDPITIPGNDLAHQRNQAIRDAVERDPACAWVLFCDTDQRVSERDVRTAVRRLLDWHVPVVSARIHQRAAPFHYNAWTSVVRRQRLLDVPRGLPEDSKDWLIPVEAVGAGFLLVRREAWEAVGDPWFRVGQLDPDHGAEDVDFTYRVHRAGLGVYVDAGLKVGHDVRGTIWPGADGRPWLELPYDFWMPLKPED
jgi:GT2 family glycosyltransferase